MALVGRRKAEAQGDTADTNRGSDGVQVEVKGEQDGDTKQED